MMQRGNEHTGKLDSQEIRGKKNDILGIERETWDFIEPGMEIPYLEHRQMVNEWQLLLLLENGDNEINLTSGRR